MIEFRPCYKMEHIAQLQLSQNPTWQAPFKHHSIGLLLLFKVNGVKIAFDSLQIIRSSFLDLKPEIHALSSVK